jgi:hypothetical protein
VLTGAVLLGAWIGHADAIASATPPWVSISWSGPDGTAGEPPNTPGPKFPHPEHPKGPRHHHHPPGPPGSGATQTFALNVLSVPPHVTPTTESISLTRWHGRGEGGPFTGELSTITVVATGSVSGWHTSISLVHLSSAGWLSRAHLCVKPDRPTLIDGNPADVVRANPPSCGTIGDSFPVFFAAPGGGGGTYSDTADVILFVPGGIDASEVTATVAVSVH